MSAPTVTGARPIQPSLRRQFAQLLAVSDPRCSFEAHNQVAQGQQCPHCHLDLWSYRDVVPEFWPS